MKNKINKKSIIIIGLVLIFIIFIVAGTYAYLYVQASINNNTYQGTSTCFLVDYGNTQAISGTMFPSAGPSKGLSGSVTLKINDSCSTTGTGTLYLHVNSGTSTKFGDTVDAHCENTLTYVTLPEYKTSSDCTSHGGTWRTGGALKFALYDNNTFIGAPLVAGSFNNPFIGFDIPGYSGIPITSTTKTIYIYIWLDGYITDNTYVNLPFDAYIWASAVQNENDTVNSNS